MRLYYYVQDNGDGSASVLWCKQEHYIDLLHEFDEHPDVYGGNEGSASFLVLPDGFDVDTLNISKHGFFDPEDQD
jgi:hypothetical protein